MKEKVDIRLIKRYTNGHYSFHDLKRMALWFENLHYHDDLKAALDQHWIEFSQARDPEEKDLSVVFNRLRIRILNERNQRKVIERFRTFYIRAAAILLLPLLVYFAFSLINHLPHRPSSEDNRVEIVSPKGTRTHFNLPDGTKVSLNGTANLTYQADFSQNRLVRLTGEAYFDVLHDNNSPFIVQTDNVDVLVLGTKFSIASLENEDITEVILEEGKVLLTGKGKGKSFSEELKPNEGFFYNKETRSGEVLSVDAKALTAWKEGKLIFRSEPLGNVLKRIGRWYNVRFEVLDKEVEKFRYRATFHDEPLEEVLRLLSLTAPVEYKIKERDMNKDGLYEEKIITIGLKEQNVSIK